MSLRSYLQRAPTIHHPVQPDLRFSGALGFLGNRLPDREARVREFFLKPAALLRMICDTWQGLEQFLELGTEVLQVHSDEEVHRAAL